MTLLVKGETDETYENKKEITIKDNYNVVITGNNNLIIKEDNIENYHNNRTINISGNYIEQISGSVTSCIYNTRYLKIEKNNTI